MNKSDKRILYVDDEVQNLQGFKVVFYDEFTIFTAETAVEALDIVAKNDIKVVISDQRMPGMSGLELFSIINEKDPDIVCIILTAFADTNAVLQAVNQGGVYRFLLKPWNELELKITIDQALERNYYKKENAILLESLKNKNTELEKSNQKLTETFAILQKNEMSLKEQNEEYLALNEELTQTIEELEIAKDRAEESDKLKRSFLQNISHEIRTPLNAIVGFSNLLNEPDTSSEKIPDYTNIITKCSSHLLAIVTDVLTISSIETGKDKVVLEEIQLLPFLMELGDIFSKEAEKKKLLFSLVCSDITENIFFNTDKTKFNQIITNLVTNAIKYTVEGRVELGCQIQGNLLKIYVKDTGIGISPEFHDFIFERFSRVESEYTITHSGTGLGLAISKAYVELLHGQIWVESTLNKGATFWVNFPFYMLQNNRMSIDKMQNFKSLLKGVTILVAEDEINNFMYLHDILISAGVIVVSAKNGVEAVNAIEQDIHVDLILMDIQMPVMNGIVASQKIKEIDRSIPIIAQTAYANFKEEHNLDNLFETFLVKPIDKNLLLTTVAEYLKKR